MQKFQRRCIKTWKRWPVWTVFINLNPINGTSLDLKALDYFCLLADDQTKQFPCKHSLEGCRVFGISTHCLFKASWNTWALWAVGAVGAPFGECIPWHWAIPSQMNSPPTKAADSAFTPLFLCPSKGQARTGLEMSCTLWKLLALGVD